jgi:hypothetical protein
MKTRDFHLQTASTPGAEVAYDQTGNGTLRLPSGPPGRYRLTQMDDYRKLSRGRFPWQPPLTFTIRARASQKNIPGTWGFGLSNDPMSLSLGFGSGRKLPALPNTVWFFFASPENHLSLRDDLPANGALAATFRSPNIPALILAPGVIAAPFLLFRPIARLLRRIASQIVQQDAVAIPIDPTDWHEYSFHWDSDKVVFRVDDQQVLETTISPRGPLGLVIWADNQFAAWRLDGGLQWGLLGCDEEIWVAFEDLRVQ